MADSYDSRIKQTVEDRSGELVSLLESFVRVASENPPGNNLTDAQVWIGDRLSAYGIPFEIHPTARGDTDHAVIIGKVGEGDRFMYLHGHYDVVPAFSPDQFVPQVKDGVIYGRGTSDMKSGVVAMLMAATIHRDLGGAGQVRLVYVPDEETGGADGSERMAELGLIETSGCAGAIVGECSFPDIWYAARGAFTVKVTVTGRPAHVGLHYKGVNAFEHAHDMIGELLSWRDSVETHKTRFMIEPEDARSSIVLVGGVSGGGTNFNIVPDEFSFTIDRRPNPDEDYDDACRELLDKLEAFRGRYQFTVEVLQDVQPASTPADDDLVKSVQSNVTKVRGTNAPLSMCPGCLETRIYSQHGIPAVAYGPGPMAVMHGPDEHVPIANLIEACTAYAAVLGDILGHNPA
jgi:acetylornithine deacetylase/succinyl-diaminopimelate desuccinylase family protein